MKSRNIYISCLILIVMLIASKATGQIVVVVNKNNSVSDVSMHELRLIYLGKTTTFSNGTDIELMEFRPLEEQFYTRALDMSKRKVRKHWLKKVFSGDHAVPPTEYDDAEEVQSRLCKHKSSICFIDIEDVSECMKVLTIEGLNPEDEEYPLRPRPKKD